MLILSPAEESLNMIFATMASKIETALKAAVVSGRVRANVDEIVSEGHSAASQLLVGREDEEAEAKGESTPKKSTAEPMKSALKTPTSPRSVKDPRPTPPVTRSPWRSRPLAQSSARRLTTPPSSPPPAPSARLTAVVPSSPSSTSRLTRRRSKRRRRSGIGQHCNKYLEIEL